MLSSSVLTNTNAFDSMSKSNQEQRIIKGGEEHG